MRTADGSAGDADYGRIGGGYADYRRPSPEIAAVVRAALGDARKVLNVGAGAGSYEPVDVEVVAVEPSEQMRSQRPAHLTPAVDAAAEDLPFPDDSFDAAMGRSLCTSGRTSAPGWPKYGGSRAGRSSY